MRVQIVVASVNELQNIRMYKPMLRPHSCEVIVVDEGEPTLRRRNEQILKWIPHRYFGPSERKAYLSRTFGKFGARSSHIIPTRCHAETSFGFLLAYEEKPQMVLELDDDTFPVRGSPILDGHFGNIMNQEGQTVSSRGRWYNTLENLQLNVGVNLFPRGHPYDVQARSQDYDWTAGAPGATIINMGLWLGDPDLDALTILSRGGVDGKSDVEGTRIKRKKVTVGKGTYFALCSMNAAFKPEIIPAFYQLYMNHMGVDRFDDIWSGIFLKKIADHLGVGVSLGTPAVRHEKRARDVFKDLRAELEGMAINQVLWRIVNGLELDGNDYWTAYRSLCYGLERAFTKIKNPLWRKFLRQQTSNMRTWLKLIDRL